MLDTSRRHVKIRASAGQVEVAVRVRPQLLLAPDTSEVRAWAKERGYEVSERGRVSKDSIAKFQEACG